MPITPHRATLGGHDVAYLQAGDGPPLLLVHGLGGHKEDFVPLIERLAPRYAVYAPDLLGFGESARTAPSIGPGAQAAALKALLDHHHLPAACLAGNSAGGWAAATFARAYPAAATKLALIDPAGLRVTLAGPPPVDFAPTTVPSMQALLAATIASPFAQTRAFATQALARFQASGEADSLAKLFADFQSPANTDRPLDDVLEGLATPTLVLWGERDGLFPVALADTVAALVPGAEKHVIPGASHFVHIDAPDALAAALTDFFG